ncbi:MAG: 50S ribosomal protein L18e [Candidatus Woesearchaeota archaeon]
MKNHYTNVLIDKLKKTKAPAWRAIADSLAGARKQQSAVNVSKLQRYAQKDLVLVVPGKVLGYGIIDTPVTVVAHQYSTQARQKIEQAKGKALVLDDYISKNPKAQKVKIIG